MQEDLSDSRFGVKDIVVLLSELVRNEKFWRAMKEMIQQYSTSAAKDIDFIEFARIMKNDYIAELTDDAKKYCIEVSKLIANADGNKEGDNK